MRPLQGCSCFMRGQMSTDKIRPIWLRQKDRSFWANWAIDSRSNRAAAQILIIFVKMVASKASGLSNEWIDILTKYQSLSLRKLKYRDMNGYSRYGLYKLYNQSWHSVVVICQGRRVPRGSYPYPPSYSSLAVLSSSLIQFLLLPRL